MVDHLGNLTVHQPIIKTEPKTFYILLHGYKKQKDFTIWAKIGFEIVRSHFRWILARSYGKVVELKINYVPVFTCSVGRLTSGSRQ